MMLASTLLAQAGGAASSSATPPTAEQLRALPKPSQAALNDPSGPRPPDIKGRKNAALVYYRTWDSIDRAVFTDVNQNYKNEPGAKLSEEHLKALKENRPFVESLMYASGIETCDWGVNFDEGPNATLPHLGLLRGSCRFLGADARRCVQEGDINGAAKRIVAVVRMSTQMRQDRCLISALVGVAINGYAISLTRNMMTENSLTPEAAHVILAAFKGMPEDPFGFGTCLDMERGMLDWARKNFTGDQAGADFSKQYLGEANSPEIEKMNQQALDAEIDKTAAFYDELDKIWGKSGKDDEFHKLEQRVEAGEFGTVARVLVPSVFKCNQSGLKANAAVEGIEKDLEAFIRGDAPKAEPGKSAK
jgi:hypothetical protein